MRFFCPSAISDVVGICITWLEKRHASNKSEIQNAASCNRYLCGHDRASSTGRSRRNRQCDAPELRR
jgi:hypothetical protein